MILTVNSFISFDTLKPSNSSLFWHCCDRFVNFVCHEISKKQSGIYVRDLCTVVLKFAKIMHFFFRLPLPFLFLMQSHFLYIDVGNLVIRGLLQYSWSVYSILTTDHSTTPQKSMAFAFNLCKAISWTDAILVLVRFFIIVINFCNYYFNTFSRKMWLSINWQRGNDPRRYCHLRHSSRTLDTVNTLPLLKVFGVCFSCDEFACVNLPSVPFW